MTDRRITYHGQGSWPRATMAPADDVGGRQCGSMSFGRRGCRSARKRHSTWTLPRCPKGIRCDWPCSWRAGQTEGPTLLVLGGVHGDEYEGPHAVRTVFRALTTDQLRGTFIGVPVTNVPAFEAGTRSSPLDGLNLARVFPGSRHGTATERIAYQVGNHLIARCDLLIDLHSSGTHAAMPTLVGYYAHDSEVGRRSRAAALAFGAPVVWGHPTVAPGRTVSEATARGIPWLYTECPGGGWLHQDTAALYARGVTNVMRQLGMLPGEPEHEPPHYHLCGSGRIEDALAVRSSGFLLPAVRPLDRVRRGDLLGTGARTGRRGTRGATRELPPGVLIFMRTTPSVSPGDLAFMVTGEVVST